MQSEKYQPPLANQGAIILLLFFWGAIISIISIILPEKNGTIISIILDFGFLLLFQLFQYDYLLFFCLLLFLLFLIIYYNLLLLFTIIDAFTVIYYYFLYLLLFLLITLFQLIFCITIIDYHL